MHDVTRRNAIRAATAAGALGLAAASTAQEAGKERDEGTVARRFETTELLRKMVFDSPVWLSFIREDRKYFFEVKFKQDQYSELAAWVRVEDCEQVIGAGYGCVFRLRLSEVTVGHLEATAWVKLQADHPGGQVATVIDERITVRYQIPMPRPAHISGQEKPFISYGVQDNRGK
ncbi:hypothetical protein [Paludisphaera mucosa]|uniref:Twin-arginine translocation signal domain-containing protein n=1 Tax=Paludisphaera mucosa TaxID=3030827 RepID=A0ABT6FKT2_9BACT|nr:hypothetical protein [Paludisphaera mucosa]MDG3008147.1 hypothetical protein [Paludisphaera mucosa]